jgi:hypothetical protein
VRRLLISDRCRKALGAVTVSTALLLTAACEGSTAKSVQAENPLEIEDSVESVADLVGTEQAEQTVPCNQCGQAAPDPKDHYDDCWQAALKKCGTEDKVLGVRVWEVVRSGECTCTISCDPSAD